MKECVWNLTDGLERFLKPSAVARGQWLTSTIIGICEAEIRRIEAKGQPRQNSLTDLIFKTTRTKWTGGVAQEVECLLCKYEALSSNPHEKKKVDREQKLSFFLN
jgi:hypothetical protein